MEPDYTLALDQAQRTFDGVAKELSAIRARAAQLLSVSGLSVSLFGGVATVTSRPMTWITWTVVLAFLSTAVLTGFLLMPKKLTVSTSAAVLVSWAEQTGSSTPKMQKKFALITEEKTAENRDRVNRWSIFYIAAGSTLLVQILALIVNLSPFGTTWSR